MQVARVHNLQKSLIDQRNLLFLQVEAKLGLHGSYKNTTTPHSHLYQFWLSLHLCLFLIFVCILTGLYFNFILNFSLLLSVYVSGTHFGAFPAIVPLVYNHCGLWSNFKTVLFNFHNHCTVEQS